MTQYVGLVSAAVWNLLVPRVDALEAVIDPSGIEISPASYDALAFSYADYDAVLAGVADYDEVLAGPYYLTTAYLESVLATVEAQETLALASVVDAELAGDRLNGLVDFPHPFALGGL